MITIRSYSQVCSSYRQMTAFCNYRGILKSLTHNKLKGFYEASLCSELPDSLALMAVISIEGAAIC